MPTLALFEYVEGGGIWLGGGEEVVIACFSVMGRLRGNDIEGASSVYRHSGCRENTDAPSGTTF
ncbi:hypothetical protein [Burkholderia sp. BE17]|uniref:hypothetical protein n=1 Tax=Burkholderia sp. BE17 TaxID=2656644 RepID=UPI00128BB1C5|nr:hypothetical protein [Burkholderia sp. BE17]MPV67456.1 hypothetical protein [Burkholderia sp. BE17]